MALYKNVASQKVAVYAHDTAADAPKTGDAANITAQVSKDGGATAASNDANPTELDATDAPGIYLFDLTQAESNADLFLLFAKSATANIVLEPVIIYTLPGTNGGVHSVPQSLATQAKADVNAEVDTALADYDGPTYTELLNLIRLAVRKDAALATDLAALLTSLNADLGSGGGAYSNQADALEALRDRGDAAWNTGTTPPTAAAIADAVWDETLADHLTAGSTGAGLNAAGSAGDPWSTALPGAYGAGSAGKILGENLNATVSSRATPAQVNTECDTALADVGLTTTVTARLDAAISTRSTLTAADVNAEVDAALDTAIPGSPTAHSVNERLQTLDNAYTATRAGYLDNVNNAALQTTAAQTGDAYGRLGAPAGASMSADVAAVQAQTAAIETDTQAIEADTQDIQSRLPAALTAGGHMKSDVLALNGVTASASNLEQSASVIEQATVNDASATTTSFVTTLTESPNDFWNGRILIFTSGALAGQATDITDYNGSTKALTVTALTAAPANGAAFIII